MTVDKLDLELASMDTRLSSVESRLTDLENKIDAMNTKLQQVVDALLGNPLTGSGGFKHDIETINSKILYLEKKQREFDEFRKRFYWTIGIITASALIIEFFVSIYTKVK